MITPTSPIRSASTSSPGPSWESSLRFRSAGLALAWSALCLAGATGLNATLAESRLLPPHGGEPQPRVVHHWGAEAAPEAWLGLGGGAPVSRLVDFPKGSLNLSGYAQLSVPVRNPGARPVLAWFCVGDEKTKAALKANRSATQHEALIPAGGATVWLTVQLGGEDAAPFAGKLLAFRNNTPVLDFARTRALDASRVVEVLLGMRAQTPEDRLEVGPIVAHGAPAPLRELPEQEAFPLFDRFGQYRHRDWPGKIVAESDLTDRKRAEELDLLAHPRLAEWNEYGGWAKGPQLRATGFFRTEKVDGKWWLVDPAGRLFWSHGIVRVGTRILVGGVYHGSPVERREYLFTLPPKGTEFARFFDTEPASTRSYYAAYPNHAVYDFLEANLYRKYGSEWRGLYAERAQARLASWGLNTIANSSDPAIYLQRCTPYTAIVYSAPMGFDEFRIAGSGGNWGKLPDPFDPAWRAFMANTLNTTLKESLDDPWCLGFFVDNELHWGDDAYVAESVLRSPAGQPAKKAFLERLKAKYRTAAALDLAWGTAYRTWEAFLSETSQPAKETQAAREDLHAFSLETIDAYFKGCRDAIKTASPRHLYLGARFADANAAALKSAARYCDVISINYYFPSTDALRPVPGAEERPILIGEFHFGALDRGPLGSALRPVLDQRERALSYTEYVRSALENPWVIGTHWFQFYDQPSSGRFDGENYQTGFVDIADTPYPETVEACRAMSRQLYRLRFGAK